MVGRYTELLNGNGGCKTNKHNWDESCGRRPQFGIAKCIVQGRGFAVGLVLVMITTHT